MAILAPNNFNDPNQQQQQQNPSQTGGTGSVQPVSPVINSGGGVAGSGGSGGVGGTAVQKPSSSGQWTNLQSYLTANQDFNNQGGGLAGKVAGNIQGAAKSANEDLSQVQDAFKNQSNNAIQSYSLDNSANKSIVNDAIANPTAFVADPSKVQQWQQLQNAQYNGPKSLADVQGTKTLTNVYGDIQNAQDMANQTQSEAGRFNLLRQMFGNTGYTQGQQSLDNLMLQGNTQQAQALSGARTYAAQAKNQLNDAMTSVAAPIQAANNEAQKTRDTVNQQVAQSFQTQKQADDAAYQAALKQYNTDTTIYKNGSGMINTDLAKSLVGDGVASGTFNTYGVDPSKFFNAAPTLSGTVTPEQAATWASLLKLADPKSITSDLSGYIDQNLAGSYKGVADGVSYRKAVQDAQNNYTNVLLPQAVSAYNTMLTTLPGWHENNIGQWENNATGSNNGKGIDWLDDYGLKGWMENAGKTYSQTPQTMGDLLSAGNSMALTAQGSPLATTRNYIMNDPFFGATPVANQNWKDTPGQVYTAAALRAIQDIIAKANPASKLNYSG